jgi:outer membrane murein-binding lipoprotein Lpp
MLRLIAVVVCITCLAGCTSAPVQEMSDARQAIAAARGAGATDKTSPELYAADAAIARAEKHLEAQEYTRARLAAMEAKHHAGAALTNAQHDSQHAEAQRGDPPPSTPQ